MGGSGPRAALPSPAVWAGPGVQKEELEGGLAGSGWAGAWKPSSPAVLGSHREGRDEKGEGPEELPGPALQSPARSSKVGENGPTFFFFLARPGRMRCPLRVAGDSPLPSGEPPQGRRVPRGHGQGRRGRGRWGDAALR